MSQDSGPLEGIRVLDCTQMLAGPYCAMRLGDLGADVLKIEPPHGEWVRSRGFGDYRAGDDTIAFHALNRNKRSINIDLKSEVGREVFYELVRNADVFLQNFRVGVADRIGVGYDLLKEINPKLVYCSISGFGDTGPYAKRPSQDLIAQAMSGSMWLSGAHDGPPQISNFWPADVMTSQQATVGIVSALFARHRTGMGQKVEVNLLASLLDASSQELMAHMILGDLPERSESWSSAHALFDAPYGIIKTSDGYIALGTVPLPTLGEALNNDTLRQMTGRKDGIEHRSAAFAAINESTQTMTTDACLKVFEEHDVWSTRVNNFEDIINDEHVRETGMLTEIEHPDAGKLPMVNVPIKMNGTPTSIRRYPPRNGEHTREVLSSILGYTDEKIDGLLDSGAVGKAQ